ncbi:MAG TPA: hypothetical protein VIH43_08665 [Chthoniobacterales bacterium]|jgi:hypothetical protein
MKQLLILTKLSFVLVVALHLGACASTTSTTAASPQKEQLLTQAGFVVKTATTDKQKEKLAALPGNQVSAVKYNGKLFYAYPAGSGNQVYVGRQKQFDTYKQLLKAQLAQAQPSSVPTTQPTIVEEGAGPNHIVVNQFDGFGPLGTDTGDF